MGKAVKQLDLTGIQKVLHMAALEKPPDTTVTSETLRLARMARLLCRQLMIESCFMVLTLSLAVLWSATLVLMTLVKEVTKSLSRLETLVDVLRAELLAFLAPSESTLL